MALVALLASLTLEEKAALTAGRDLWSSAPIERAGIPSVGLTDGPNGARGMGLPGLDTEPTACTPCGSALGATWDGDLVGRVAALVAREARAKGCHVLLAPTVNLHRSPLGGRTFEAFSEDPYLTGRLAAAYVRGAQSEGVAAVVKHFAANETELERMTADSVVDERTLREMYLAPFEAAVRDGGCLGVMSAYNRLGGTWCSEHAELFAILRGEWGFDGIVITDWFAGAHTVAAARAGLDLEMPGPGRAYGPALAAAVRAGELPESILDAAAGRILDVWQRVGALDPPAPPPAVDTDTDRALLREAAAAATVLLRNDGLLPLPWGDLTSIAVVGPNAARARIAGGGSAQVRAYHRTPLLDALRSRLGSQVRIGYEQGCDIDPVAPLLDGAGLVAPDGEQGLAVSWFRGAEWDGPAVGTTRAAESNLAYMTPPVAELAGGPWSLRAEGTFRPPAAGAYALTLAQAGRARLFLDGELLLDGIADPPGPGTHFFGMGSTDITATVRLSDGPHEIAIELCTAPDALITGVRVGARPVPSGDALDRAAALAAQCDVAVVVVGTNDVWESEGTDRDDLTLPGEQDELVRRVVAANPRTVVVVNTGAPVLMPWADSVPAILQAWFGGQEMADALVDVLGGERDPGGRLPTTFPMRLEDIPSYPALRPENHVVRYSEGVFMGYRWYDTRRLPPRFAFGHGLSYTDIAVGPPAVSSPAFHPGETLELRVPVCNVGDRPGSEVVQCYVVPPASPVSRPPQELKAFAKVHLQPGEEGTVSLHLDERAFAYWHTGDGPAVAGPAAATLMALPGMTQGIGRPSGEPRGWRIVPGDYDLVIARSAMLPLHRVAVHVASHAVDASCNVSVV